VTRQFELGAQVGELRVLSRGLSGSIERKTPEAVKLSGVEFCVPVIVRYYTNLREKFFPVNICEDSFIAIF
jgi:hypothetical protein